MKRLNILIVIFSIILTGCHEDVSYLEDCFDSNPSLHANYDPSVLYTEWVKKNKTRTQSGEELYPGWYGGCFQENGLLVFQCTDAGKTNILPEGTECRVCRYSYNQLDSITDIIREKLMAADDSCFSNVIGYGVQDKYNRIMVLMRNTSEEEIKKFKSNVYSEEEYIIFKNILDFRIPTLTSISDFEPLPLYPENYIICGSQLINPYTKMGASLGYRVKYKNGSVGFMTAGHFVYQGKYVTNEKGDTIGLCKQCYRRNVMDASYCELTNDNFELSNYIRMYAATPLSIKSVVPAEDAYVTIIGSIGAFQAKVLCNSFEFTFYDDEDKRCSYTNQIIMNQASVPGNSGGVVIHRNETSKELLTVGILGGNCTIDVSPVLGQAVSFCCKQEVIESYMGVERY